jgi:hypothetical protein
VQCYFDLRYEHDGSGTGPVARGWSKNMVPADKRFEPKPQQPATTVPPAAA